MGSFDFLVECLPIFSEPFAIVLVNTHQHAFEEIKYAYTIIRLGAHPEWI